MERSASLLIATFELRLICGPAPTAAVEPHLKPRGPAERV